jgi:uracil-DNA glycosylase
MSNEGVRPGFRLNQATVIDMGTAKAASPPASELIPAHADIPSLADAAASCKACDLWTLGGRTVFGEGRPTAELMVVGEVPGDVEDREGHVFVGPAGRLLDEAFAAARIDRSRVYLTNAVKHFKWEARGKRRIHSKPDGAEIQACKPWLLAELAAVKPTLAVALGAVAAQTLLGHDFRVTKSRGELIRSPLGYMVMATIHPSSILRAPDDAARHQAMADFIHDLTRVHDYLTQLATKAA